MHRRTNRATAAALRELRRNWHGLEEAARAFLSRHGDTASGPLAEHLRAAFAAYRRAAAGPFLAELVRFALARIDWRCLADTLARAARRRLKTDANDLLRLLRERGRRLP